MRNPSASVVILTMFGTLSMIACGEASESEELAEAEPRGSDTHPAWSPDGASLAFISNREGVRVGTPINFEVYRVEVDGSGERRLTTNQDFEADVAWSPDGTMILFKSFRDGNDEVYVMDADGGDQRNLTNSDASDGGAVWSPDGSTILFQSDRAAEASRFYLMDADGSNLRALPNDPGPGHSPDLSPDGTTVAFVSDRDGDSDVYVMDADGSNVRRLTDDPLEEGYPRWSPDGSTIAYTMGSFETDRWSIMLVDATGGNPRQIVGEVDSGNAAWSPDGTRIAFGRYRRYGPDGGDESELFVLDVSTGVETRVSNRDGKAP